MKPFSLITGLASPPQPGTLAFKLWLVEIGRERRPVTARAAGPEDRERLWPRLVEAYPAFATYQARTEREIPVVVLSRS